MKSKKLPTPFTRRIAFLMIFIVYYASLLNNGVDK